MQTPGYHDASRSSGTNSLPAGTLPEQTSQLCAVFRPEGMLRGARRPLEGLAEPGLGLPAVLLLPDALPFGFDPGTERLVDELVLILDGTLEPGLADAGLATTTGLPEASRLISWSSPSEVILCF